MLDPATSPEVDGTIHRLEQLLASEGGDPSGDAHDELGLALSLLRRLRQQVADLELLYETTVEASTALENDLLNRHEAVTNYLAHTSHELRTPLNAIIGHTELVMEELADKGEHVHHRDLEQVRTSGLHLLALLDGILDLSRVEAGRLELSPEDLDLAVLVQGLTSTMEPLARRNGNVLVLQLSAKAGTVHTDATRLRQIILNLVGNACKFTKNGRIELSAWREHDVRGEWVCLGVRDSGIGMTPDQLSRVFQAYTQASAETSRQYGGTGLGLAYTRALCEQLGGDVKAKSTLGEGSTFTVRLPA